MIIEQDGKFEIIAKYKTNDKEYELDAVVSGNKYDLLARQEDIEELVDTEGEVSVKVIDNRPKHLKLDFVNKKYNLNDEEVDFYDVADFKRLTKATTFDENGLKVYGIDEPRIVQGKGLLIEPESTNFLLNNMDPTKLISNSGDGWIKHSGIDITVNSTLSGFDIVETTDSNIDYIANTNSYFIENKPEWATRTLIHIQNPNGKDTAFSFRNRLDGSATGFGIGYIPNEGRIKDYNKILQENTGVESCGIYNTVWMTHEQKEFDSGFWLRGSNRELGVMLTYYAGQLEPLQFRTSIIVTEDTQTTRTKDFLLLNIPKGYTVSGDWDDTLELYEKDGRLHYDGIGYIRKLEVRLIKSYTIDFTTDSVISNTGFVHKGIFERGIAKLDRLSEATTFDENGLKVYGIDEPRIVQGKGLLIEPESTNFLLYSSDMSNPYWTPIGVTVEGNVITQDATNGLHQLNTPSRSVPQFDHTRAVHLIVSTESARYLSLDSLGGGASSGCVFNLVDNSFQHQSGARGEFINSSFSLTSFGNLYQMKYTIKDTGAWDTTVQSNLAVKFFLEKSHAVGSRSFVGDGVTNVKVVYAGACVEELASSPILTNGTPTTRLADYLDVQIPEGYKILVDKDEQVSQDQNSFEGFGYIRKIEVVKE